MMRIVLSFLLIITLCGFKKPPLAERIAVSKKPLFSDTSPHAVPLLKDRAWVMAIDNGRSNNPDLTPTEPSSMEFWRKPDTKNTYESALYDNVLFLGNREKGFIVQATQKADGKTYYFLFRRISPSTPFPRPLYGITLLYHDTLNWPNHSLRSDWKIDPTKLDAYLKSSKYEDIHKRIPIKGLEDLYVHNHWFYFLHTLKEMEKHRDVAQAYLNDLDAKAAHQAKLRSWDNDLRPPLFRARLAANCAILQGATTAAKDLGDQLTRSMRVKPDNYDRFSATTSPTSCTINLAGIARMTLEIGTIDFDECVKRSVGSGTTNCEIKFQIGCYSNTGLAVDECNRGWERAQISIKGNRATFLRLN